MSIFSKILSVSRYLLFIPFLSLSAHAQNLFPEAGPVFRDDLLPVIRLRIPTESLDNLYANPLLDVEYPMTFCFQSGTIQDTLYEVGLRFRGNTSRSSPKKSFKISFNTFVRKRDYYGLEKMNLNGEHNDPSVIRSKLYWDLCRDFGIPAPRANHVLLYINDAFMGVYINVEQIDEEFTGLRFGSKNGNLYKCLYPADLTYLGSNPDNYKFTSGNRRAYELKTNEDTDDYYDLAHLIDILNNTTAQQQQRYEEVLNLPVLLRIIALDVFTGNWDGPFYNKNNFYLYDNPATGRFEIIPYDVDNTFGIDWFSVDWARRDVYNWSPSGWAIPLYTRIIAIPELRKEYTRRFTELIDLVETGDYLQEHAKEIRDRFAGYLSADPLYPQNYEWNLNDFYQSYTVRLSTFHVPIGLFPYIDTRIASARSQLDNLSGSEDPAVQVSIRIYPNPASDQLFIKWKGETGQYRLLHLNGQAVRSGSLSDSPLIRMDISDLPEGLYLLDLQTGESGQRSVFEKVLIAR